MLHRKATSDRDHQPIGSQCCIANDKVCFCDSRCCAGDGDDVGGVGGDDDGPSSDDDDDDDDDDGYHNDDDECHDDDDHGDGGGGDDHVFHLPFSPHHAAASKFYFVLSL